MVKTLLIDNHDSFTYNLAELLTAVNGTPPTVVPNDVPWASLDFAAFDNAVISPGPGDPTVPGDFGVCARVIADSGPRCSAYVSVIRACVRRSAPRWCVRSRCTGESRPSPMSAATCSPLCRRRCRQCVITLRSEYPDAALTFAERAVVIDHERGRTYLLAAGDWFDRVGAAVCGVEPAGGRAAAAVLTRRGDATPHLRHDARAYRARIEASLDLIAAGQIYEVCLTNTARVERGVDPLATFDRVRALNPAPHAALLEFPGMSVISASPERFVRIGTDRSVEAKPIKAPLHAASLLRKTRQCVTRCRAARRSAPRI